MTHVLRCLGMLTPALWVSAASSFAQVSVNVSLDPANTIGSPVPDYGLALHTSVYSNNYSHPALAGVIADSGTQMLRYPGGSYSDLYHWSTHSGEQGIYTPNGSDFGVFVELLDASNTAGMVTVNYGSSHQGTMGGQPEEAAAWVAYANGSVGNNHVIGTDLEGNNWRDVDYWARLRTSTRNEYRSWSMAQGVYDADHEFLAINHDAPVGITYWEIGNELNGNGYYDNFGDGWEYDVHAPYDGNRYRNPALSPTAYGNNFVAFADAMKAVDPTIQIGAVLVGSGYGNDSNPAHNWDRNVLLAADEAIDFGIYHYYVDNGSSPTPLYEGVDSLPGEFQLLRDRLDTFTTAGAAGIPIHMTEFGFFGSVPQDSYAAFFDADVYMSAMREGVQSVHFLEMNKDGFVGDGTPDPGEAYYAIQLVDLITDPGDTFFEVTSSVDTLRVHGVKKDDGTVALLFINVEPGDVVNDAEITLDLAGLNLTGNAVRYEYGWNEVADDDPIQVSSLTGVGDTLDVTVPDVSMVALIFEAAAFLAGDYNGNGQVEQGDLDLVLQNWGFDTAANGVPTGWLQDLPQGLVDQAELDGVLQHWGSAATPNLRAIPEPGAVWMVAGAVIVASRRTLRTKSIDLIPRTS